MPRQAIELGTVPTGQGGDTNRDANTKINAMTAELYASAAKADTALQPVAGSGLYPDADRTKLAGIAAGAQVNVATNLGQGTRTSTALPLTSSTGTGTTLPAATTSLAGLQTAADKAKLDGLGTAATKAAQTSPTDTTPGALMAVGAFGLGWGMQVGPNSPDSLTGPFNGGCFAALSNNDAWSNNPYGGTNNNWWKIISCKMGSNNYALQLAQAYGGQNQGTLFVRSIEGGTLTPWRLLYSQSTIIGSVSQSGGVPTGALVETGSNANGRYRKHADGTLECWGFSPEQSIPAGGRVGFSGTFPAQFIADPVFIPTAVGGYSGFFTTSNEGSGTTTWIAYMVSALSSAFNQRISWYAKGRWY